MARTKAKTRPPRTSPDDPVTAWAGSVVSGEIVAGPNVRNACRRHLKDLQDGASRGLVWDLTAALRAINFFPEVLRLSQGQFDGLEFRLEPTQAFIVGSIFGWKREDGRRRFRRCYIEIAKGAGKSPLAAGIGLYCLVADGEAQAQVFSAATLKAQARVVFDFAVRMWQQSKALTKRLTPTGQLVVQNLADMKTGSFFRPVSTEEGKLSGQMPSCAICDEVHEHPNGLLIEMMERGFKSRAQPLLIMITNSGSDRNSVCWEEHKRAVQVAAGTVDVGPNATETTFIGDVIDDAQFSFVCGLDEGDDPLTDESCWLKANPLLGVTYPVEEMRRVIAQAKAIPGKLNGILRLHCCVWTDSDQAWMSRSALESVLCDFDPQELVDYDLHLGVDLSATQDLTAIGYCVMYDRDADGRPLYAAWVEAWTPEETLADRALRDNAPYEIWAGSKEKWLKTTPGKVIRFDFVAARIADVIGQGFRVSALAFDSYGFKKHFEPALEELGVSVPLVEHPQGGKKKGAESGLWMPGSKMLLENLILEKRIKLLRSPVLISAMMAATIKEDPWGNSWFVKQRDSTRIDPLISLAMAVGSTVSLGTQQQMFVTERLAVL